MKKAREVPNWLIQDVLSISLLSAATAAARDGGRWLKLPLSFSIDSGSSLEGATLNRDSKSLRVNTGWSIFFLFALMYDELVLLLFNLYMLSSTVFCTYQANKKMR